MSSLNNHYGLVRVFFNENNRKIYKIFSQNGNCSQKLKERVNLLLSEYYLGLKPIIYKSEHEAIEKFKELQINIDANCIAQKAIENLKNGLPVSINVNSEEEEEDLEIYSALNLH